MKTITELCEDLVSAFEAKGANVSSNLRPGISSSEYAKVIGFPEEELPSDLLELYQWRNGCFDEYAFDEDTEHRLMFRDNIFISVERAREELTNFDEDPEGDDRFDLKRAIPIAFWEGATYAVVTGSHKFGSNLTNPIIEYFEGIDLSYDSIRSMLETCIAWVSDSSWIVGYGVDTFKEKEIWDRHNPITRSR